MKHAFRLVAIVVVGETESTNREAWNESHLGDRDSLDLLGAQDELIRRVVETGTADDTYSAILKGLKDDEEIVVGPSKVLNFLKDGERVVKNPPAPAPAAVAGTAAPANSAPSGSAPTGSAPTSPPPAAQGSTAPGGAATSK